MMALVWLIDLIVIVVKILGGRMRVNPVLRAGLWLAVSSVAAAGAVAVGFALVLLDHRLAA
nr:hypothetical protein [Nocardia pseudobrasiliensis]